MKIKTTILTLIISISIAGYAHAASGPIIVPRDMSDPSIHEGPSGQQDSGVKQVYPFLGLMPASYSWFGGFARAIGSLIKTMNLDPKYLGYKSGQQSFQYSETNRGDRLFQGEKGLGGQNVTDTAQLGTPGGKNPGDPFWVGYPRPGNTEFAPPFQAYYAQYDCFCRVDENIYCPLIENPLRHRQYGGNYDYPISCVACFGIERIRKHDFYVGKSRGTFPGYPSAAPDDSGYQECLRQSIESFAASESGGPVQGEQELYGL